MTRTFLHQLVRLPIDLLLGRGLVSRHDGRGWSIELVGDDGLVFRAGERQLELECTPLLDRDQYARGVCVPQQLLWASASPGEAPLPLSPALREWVIARLQEGFEAIGEPVRILED